jgi:hypothetical protein
VRTEIFRIGEKKIMKLLTGLFLLVAAFALVGCEKKVEAPVVADAAVEAVDAGVAAAPACCEADGAAPVAPLVVVAPAATETVNTTAGAPVVAPTTTIKK